jgi:thiamine biosynthesis lipoprotein
MGAAFQIALVEPDRLYARQAAAAAFAELEQIESRLSRYVETSDLFRVNRLGRGQATVVHIDTFQCLRIALEVQAATGGAFDAAYGSARSVGQTFLSADEVSTHGPLIELIEAGCSVHVLADGVRLDLGGIGKGFALDRMAAMLAEWDITAALLCASTSTVLALDAPPGEPGWTVHLACEPSNSVPLLGTSSVAHNLPSEHCLFQAVAHRGERRVYLANQAISGSGTAVRGAHIIDPRTGRPAEGKFRAWSIAPTGAEADALSTAFMVMSESEIHEFCERRPEVSAYILPESGRTNG